MTLSKLDRQSGFSLVITLGVTVVLILLAGAIFANILSSQKGSRLTQVASRRENDAEVALEMAENELYYHVDRMQFTAWSIATNSLNVTDSTDSAVDTGDPSAPSPVHELELVGNSRNWPAFCDWSFFIKNYGGEKFSAMDWPAGLVPDDALYGNPNGQAALEKDTPASPGFNEDDPCLTRGWWYVPRDTRADNDYYSPGNCRGGTPYALPAAANPPIYFPVDIAGVGTPTSGWQQTTTFTTNGVTMKNIPTVPHMFWYKDAQAPICAQPSATTSLGDGVLKYVYWPNANDFYGRALEYGNGCNLAGSPVTEQGGRVGRGAQIFDTPVYKKIYTMPDGLEVAVYCRMSPYSYFKPARIIPGNTPPFTSWEETYMGMTDSSNTMAFFLAAVPEGRIDVDTSSYLPSVMVTKYVYIPLGGAEVTELASSSDDPASQDGLVEVHQYTTLDSNRETLIATTSNAIFTMTGQVFRANGDLGFNWLSYPWNQGPATISEYDMVDILEEQPIPGRPGQSDTYFLGVAGSWLPPTWSTDEASWLITRYLYLAGGGEQAGEPGSGGGYPPNCLAPYNACFNAAASFSAIVDADGEFTLSSASGDPHDPLQFADGTKHRWLGPVPGATYSTMAFGNGDRIGFPFAASDSVTR